MKGHYYSIKLPFGKIVHYKTGRRVGESRPACFKGLAHYDHRGRPTGKSIRNLVGDLNHYNCRGDCTGFSKRKGLCATEHFDPRGQLVGKTYSLVRIIFLHWHHS